jgi:hypothetical protein
VTTLYVWLKFFHEVFSPKQPSFELSPAQPNRQGARPAAAHEVVAQDVLGFGVGLIRILSCPQRQDQLRDVMAAGWKARGRRKARVLAACGHAADFQAWRSLARKQGLDDSDVIDSMVALIGAAAGRTG